MHYRKQSHQLERILSIVKRLYALEELHGTKLADQYDISTKTIQRDFAKIAEQIPLIRSRGSCRLDTAKAFHSHNGLHREMLCAFAHNAQIPIEYFDRDNLSQDRISYAIEYNHLPKELGEAMIDAIDNGCKCQFTYTKPEGSTQRTADPVKLYTENGRWYLIAKDDKDSIVKKFFLGRISNFTALPEIPHMLTDADIAEADGMLSIWSQGGKDGVLVCLYAKPHIADYIRQTPLHKSQAIHNEHYDGGVELHYIITHELELLPQIKSWLPNVHILEPKWLRDELARSLEIYRDEMDRDYEVDE